MFSTLCTQVMLLMCLMFDHIITTGSAKFFWNELFNSNSSWCKWMIWQHIFCVCFCFCGFLGVRVIFRVGLVLLKCMLGSQEKLKACEGQYETMERLRAIEACYMQEVFLIKEVQHTHTVVKPTLASFSKNSGSERFVSLSRPTIYFYCTLSQLLMDVLTLWKCQPIKISAAFFRFPLTCTQIMRTSLWLRDRTCNSTGPSNGQYGSLQA